MIGTVSSNGTSLTLTPAANFQVIAQESNKSPAQVAQEFNVFQQVLSTYDTFKAIAPNTPPPSDGKRGDANPQSTTKYASAGSSTPPSDTNSTQIIPTSVSAQHLDADTETTVVVTPSSSVSVNPTQPTSLLQAPIIPAPPHDCWPSRAQSAVGNIINQSEVSAGFTISGTATAGNVPVNGQTATIAIVDSSNVVKYTYTTTVTNGVWSVKVTAAQAHALADGSYSIQATVSDTTGNTATTVIQTITVDTVPPTVTISTTDTTTNQPTQTISGHVTATEAAAGATVTLLDTVNGVTTQIGTATVGSGGAWTTSVTLSGDGAHSIVAQDTDAAGNTGTSARGRVHARHCAPTVTISTAAETSNVATQTISGSVTAGEAAVGATVPISTTMAAPRRSAPPPSAGAGSWTTTVTLSGDGAHSIVAQDTDAAGNTGTSTPVVFTLDTLAPTVAITSRGGLPTTRPRRSPELSPPARPRSAPPSISTTTAAPPRSAPRPSAAAGCGPPPSRCRAMAPTPSSPRTPMPPATPAASTAVVFTLDTLAPTVAITSSGGLTNDATQTISGSVAAGEAAVGGTVYLYDNGGTTAIGTATVGSGGAWTTTVTLSGDGAHTIVAQDTDAAGNTGSSTAVVFTLDTIAPTVAITSAAG